jgi:hypothetical protein
MAMDRFLQTKAKRKLAHRAAPGAPALIADAGQFSKLHFACGPNLIEGWINLDLEEGEWLSLELAPIVAFVDGCAAPSPEERRPSTMTHDYKPHSATTLFAALDVKSCLVIGECQTASHQRVHQLFETR